MATFYLEQDNLPAVSGYQLEDIVVLLKSNDVNRAYEKVGDSIWKEVGLPAESIKRDHQAEHDQIGQFVMAETNLLTGGVRNTAAGAYLPVGPNVNVFGMTPVNTRKWRRMLSRVKAGTGRGRVLIKGDSTTAGAGAGTSTTGCAGAFALSWPSKLAQYLSQIGVPAQAKSITGNQGITSQVTYPAYDPRVALGNGWGTSIATLGGNSFLFTSGSGVGTMSLTEICTKFTVFYASGFSVGTATVTVDGGASLGTISAAGGYAMNQQTFSAGALGQHTLQINANNNGNFMICGVVAWDDTAPAIDIVQAAQFGATTAPFVVANGGSAPWAALAMDAAFAPDLTIIQLGVNDARSSVAVATYQANLATLISTAKAAGSDVLLMDILPDNQVTTAVQDPYVDAAYAAAAAAGVPIASISSQIGALFAAGNAAGLYYDTVHMSAKGYASEASWMSDVISLPRF